MTHHDWLYMIVTAFNAFQVAYGSSGAVLVIGRFFHADRDSFFFRVANKVWLISKYPALVNACIGPGLWVMLNGHLTGVDYLAAALNAFVWWSYRNEGDDDWKNKFKEKADAIVQVFHGKLVVVPQAAS